MLRSDSRRPRLAARLAIAIALVAPLLATSSEQPAAADPPTQVFFDHLDDFSRAYSHSAQLTFDKANTSQFGGDISRLTRVSGSPTAEQIVWFGYGILSFHAVAYYAPADPVSHLAFSTSADGVTWTSASPTITGGTGNWLRYDYNLSGLTNVNYVRVTWTNLSGTATTPQLSDIDFTASPIAAYFDPLDSWARSYSHTAGLVADATNPASFGGDTTRITRSNPTAESVVWRAVGMYSFHATAYYAPGQPVSHLAFATSADGVNWTTVTPATAGGTGSWIKYDYYLLFLSNVNYVRVTWTNLSGQASTPQISGVDWTTTPTNIVQRFGTTLVLDGNPYRYSGTNVYWLGVRQSGVFPNLLDINPSQFEVDDVLATAVEMGGTVVRSLSLGTSVGCLACLEPTLGVYNEAAFDHYDMVIARAKALGIRLILTLTNGNAPYFGSDDTFENWRGAPAGAFYTDPTVIADFKDYVSHLLNRFNDATGLYYRDDPTILAWETGNELGYHEAWTQDITQYIRSLDQKHLIIDGTYGVNPTTAAMSTVDVVSNHYYPMNTASSPGGLGLDLYKAGVANKPLYVGEFGWRLAGSTPLTTWLDILRQYPGVVGDTYWSLFGHADTSGYLPHFDGYTIHYPGEAPPDYAETRGAAQELREHAYRMRSVPVPAHGVPQAAPGNPVFLPYIFGYVLFSWRGATLADRYLVQYSTSASGPWTDACTVTGVSPTCPTDNDVPGVIGPIPLGPKYVRVQGVNLAGVGGPFTSPVLVAL